MSGMLAWLAIQTKEEQVSGNVYDDFPGTPSGKRYRSILAIPVKVGKDVVGVVSIDASQKYAFDDCAVELSSYLLPYVRLLGWTLPSRTTTIKKASEEPS